MGIRLVLLMTDHIQFPCFGGTLKVCLVFIVLTFTSSMACGGGGGGGWVAPPSQPEEDVFNDRDDQHVVNLTGIKDPVDRNIIAGWNGWEPSNKTKDEWKKFHKDYLDEMAKSGDFHWKLKKGDGSDMAGGNGSGMLSYKNFAHERGPETGWPNLPGWADLGAGNGGTPVPPWAYSPKHVGKPSVCYLPPLLGSCEKGVKANLVPRWGYNPYVDECVAYAWSGCGGTRNKFVTKEKCEKTCMSPPIPACTDNSGILDTTKKVPFD